MKLLRLHEINTQVVFKILLPLPQNQTIDMKHISVESIEKAINKVDNLNDEGLEKLAETYALAQQTLLGYVMSAAVEYKNDQL